MMNYCHSNPTFPTKKHLIERKCNTDYLQIKMTLKILLDYSGKFNKRTFNISIEIITFILKILGNF
jgi:hypothetical protein